MRKIQIGVMGSCSDLKYKKRVEQLAEEVGFWVAKSGAILMYGAEKDTDSLSTAACRGARKAGGICVGVTYNKGLTTFDNSADIIITSGSERGGGREFVLVLSCDAIITVSGGSGTLTEIAIAYQANIPIVALENTGGWSSQLKNTYLDSRKRIKIIPAASAKLGVLKALKLATNKLASDKIK